jgi:hypothetical protein
MEEKQLLLLYLYIIARKNFVFFGRPDLQIYIHALKHIIKRKPTSSEPRNHRNRQPQRKPDKIKRTTPLPLNSSHFTY